MVSGRAVELIGDVGSCHMGDRNRALRLAWCGLEAGLDAVKFQLLTDAQLRGGNIGLDWDFLPTIRDQIDGLACRVFASAFDHAGVRFLAQHGFRDIKFAYSQWALFTELVKGSELAGFDRIYVSSDPMRPDARAMRLPRRDLRLLYCIPEYPVRYRVDFEGLFGGIRPRFDGFSSHCLGIEQDLEAVRAGARILEVHFTLDDPMIDCPDHGFALRPAQLKELVERVRALP